MRGRLAVGALPLLLCAAAAAAAAPPAAAAALAATAGPAPAARALAHERSACVDAEEAEWALEATVVDWVATLLDQLPARDVARGLQCSGDSTPAARPAPALQRFLEALLADPGSVGEAVALTRDFAAAGADAGAGGYGAGVQLFCGDAVLVTAGGGGGGGPDGRGGGGGVQWPELGVSAGGGWGNGSAAPAAVVDADAALPTAAQAAALRERVVACDRLAAWGGGGGGGSAGGSYGFWFTLGSPPSSGDTVDGGALAQCQSWACVCAALQVPGLACPAAAAAATAEAVLADAAPIDDDDVAWHVRPAGLALLAFFVLATGTVGLLIRRLVRACQHMTAQASAGRVPSYGAVPAAAEP